MTILAVIGGFIGGVVFTFVSLLLWVSGEDDEKEEK